METKFDRNPCGFASYLEHMCAQDGPGVYFYGDDAETPEQSIIKGSITVAPVDQFGAQYMVAIICDWKFDKTEVIQLIKDIMFFRGHVYRVGTENPDKEFLDSHAIFLETLFNSRLIKIGEKMIEE